MSGLDPIALAAFIQAPDANTIMLNLAKLPAELRASYVGNLELMAAHIAPPAPQQALPAPLTGEGKDTRIVERRLRGETISQIAEAEQASWKEVKAAIRAAQNEGVNITLTDPYRRQEETKAATPKKRASPVITQRLIHPEYIRKFMADKRMSGIGPNGVLTALKEEHNYTTTVRAISAQLKLYARKHGLRYPPIGGPPSAIIQSLDEHRQQVAN